LRWRFPPVVNGSGKLPSSHFHTSILLLYCGNMLLKGKSWCFQTFPVWKSSFLSRMLEWGFAYYSLVFIDRWIGFIEMALNLISVLSIFIFFICIELIFLITSVCIFAKSTKVWCCINVFLTHSQMFAGKQTSIWVLNMIKLPSNEGLKFQSF